MKVGRIKDPLYKDTYFGITPPTFIPPFEALDLIAADTLRLACVHTARDATNR